MEAAASQDRPRPSRRRISGGERRESILALTSRAFAERGYDGVRTAELAKSAGVSEALIYQHFRTKAELYRAAVDRSAEILEDRLTTAASSGPANERLERAVNAFLEFVSDATNAWRVLALHVSDAELADYQRSLRGRATGALAGLFEADPRASGNGLTRDQLEQLSEVIVGGAEALANWWSQNPAAERRELASLLTAFAWSGFEQLVSSNSSQPSGR
jgi:AcrR family transcriptional regulator